MQEALFYDKSDDGRTLCRLCPKLCNIRPGHRGFCRVRKNDGGTLYAANYGQVTSLALDPIEKKPLYHFYPGSYILSLGTLGCNLKCGFCQNWRIAHGEPDSVYMSPREAVAAALSRKEKGYPNIGLAYTYSEPLMWYEYVYDTAKLAGESGLKNVLVTNGYVNPEPLLELLPYIDAMNVDVKGFSDRYYRDTCLGRLDPVMKTVELSHSRCHLEITTLLVPGLNDSPEEIRELARWVAGLNSNIPLHFSRYFPNFNLDIAPTPLETLKTAREIAGDYLNYVYIGNAPQLDAGKTCCPECGEVLLDRAGYNTRIAGIKGGKCQKCGARTGIVMRG